MQYKLVMFLSKVACHTPYRLLMAVGWVLGNLYYLLIKKERERAVSQMMPALGIEEPEARHLVRLSFINLARNVLEILYMPHLSEKNFGEYIEIDHLERLTDALAEGHGVAIVTGHIGTWEWLSAAFTLNGLPVTAIAKPQPNMQYTYALNDLRKTIHVEIFSRGTSELIAAARALKSGKILGFLVDHSCRSSAASRRRRWARLYSRASSIPPSCRPSSCASRTASIRSSSARSCAMRTRATRTRISSTSPPA